MIFATMTFQKQDGGSSRAWRDCASIPFCRMMSRRRIVLSVVIPASAATPGGRDARLTRWPTEAAAGCSVDLTFPAE